MCLGIEYCENATAIAHCWTWHCSYKYNSESAWHKQQFQVFGCNFDIINYFVLNHYLLDILTLTTRVIPSEFANTSVTLARGHWPLGFSSSVMMTMSPTAIDMICSHHFFLAVSLGTFSQPSSSKVFDYFLAILKLLFCRAVVVVHEFEWWIWPSSCVDEVIGCEWIWTIRVDTQMS